MIVDAAYGEYNWTETKAESNATLECFYGTTTEAGDDGRARRTCRGPRMWGDFYERECITLTTLRFRQLGNVRFLTKRITLKGNYWGLTLQHTLGTASSKCVML